ncbi:MAG: response regulator [Polyangiaceae bacterium]
MTKLDRLTPLVVDDLERSTEKSEHEAAVLLVDDDPPLLTALTATLEGRIAQIALEPCASSRRALELLSTKDYDVIVTDVRMPDVGGLELLAHAKTHQPDSPVILMTGLATEEFTLRALRGGAYDFIAKPVDAVYLTMAVERAIETRRLRRENERRREALERHAAELERTVEERTHALREANRMKDEFLATVSHELRTPLTPILGWARLLRSGKLDSTSVAQALESIERNARAQAQLVDDLLDVSRIVTGKLRLDRQIAPMGETLAAALDVVAPLARAKDITLEVPANLELFGPIEGDPKRLQQVFWNLLTNAVKFTPPRGRVQLELERSDAEVTVRVRDTGCGIRPQLLPHVFDRFRQGRSTEARAGLGLGLSIVRHIVALHGGQVRAESAGEGHGATFIVELPIGDVRDTARMVPAPRRRATPREEAPPSRCLHGVQLLLVEDSVDAQHMLAVALESAGARVAVAATSEEAKQHLSSGAVHIILCDIGLGEDHAAGYELLRWVRALPPERGGAVPAVALTALAKPEDRVQALAAGFQLHLPKPGPPNLPLILSRLLQTSTPPASWVDGAHRG